MRKIRLLKRWFRHLGQRMKYGFDDSETWNLDHTIIAWLHSHLKRYLEVSDMVDKTFYKFDIPVLEDIPIEEQKAVGSRFAEAYQREVIREDITEEECINIAIEYMERYLKEDDDNSMIESFEIDARKNECARCALKIIAEIFPTLWW